jgi:8-oxo-dGTP pyrophosphatase MutT (NUDIX family)
MIEPDRIDGICWVLIEKGGVYLERCPKKTKVLGTGKWFVPGGKLERDEDPTAALHRELGEEWPSVKLEFARPLPLVEGSPVGIYGQRGGVFLMRPYLIKVSGTVPIYSADGVEVRWFPLLEAIFLSPVPQVRMMVTAANEPDSRSGGL